LFTAVFPDETITTLQQRRSVVLTRIAVIAQVSFMAKRRHLQKRKTLQTRNFFSTAVMGNLGTRVFITDDKLLNLLTADEAFPIYQWDVPIKQPRPPDTSSFGGFFCNLLVLLTCQLRTFSIKL